MKHNSLVSALAAFQAELPQVAKTSTAAAGKFTYDYADLADVSAAVLPVLGRNGLAWSAVPTLTENGFALLFALRHEAGDAIEGVYPLPPATMAPQQLGAAITYARRYALCAVTGVAPGGEDSDAVAEPSEDWEAMIHAAGSVDELAEIAAILKESGEGNAKLRVVFAARQGILKRAAEAEVAPDGFADASEAE